MIQTIKWAATLALLVAVCVPVEAGIISANFNESLDLPGFGSAGPRLLQNNGVSLPSAGPQLTAAHTIANPSGWSNVLEVTFDANTNILSLTADGNNNYQFIAVTLSNLNFSGSEQVIGITPIVLGSAVTPGSGVPTVTTGFTANSFTVTYQTTGFQVFDINPQPARDSFLITLGPASGAVPEPASMAIWSLGALGCAFAGYRRRKLGVEPRHNLNFTTGGECCPFLLH